MLRGRELEVAFNVHNEQTIAKLVFEENSNRSMYMNSTQTICIGRSTTTRSLSLTSKAINQIFVQQTQKPGPKQSKDFKECPITTHRRDGIPSEPAVRFQYRCGEERIDLD